jgi:hypothetical protein
VVLAGGPLGIMRNCLDVVMPYLHERQQFDLSHRFHAFGHLHWLGTEGRAGPGGPGVCRVDHGLGVLVADNRDHPVSVPDLQPVEVGGDIYLQRGSASGEESKEEKITF